MHIVSKVLIFVQRKILMQSQITESIMFFWFHSSSPEQFAI